MSICCVTVLLKKHGVWGAYWVEKFPRENEWLHVCSWNNYIKNRMPSSSFLHTWKLLVNWRANWNPNCLNKASFSCLKVNILNKTSVNGNILFVTTKLSLHVKIFCFTLYYWVSLLWAELINIIEQFSLILVCSQVDLSEFTSQHLWQCQCHKRSIPDLQFTKQYSTAAALSYTYWGRVWEKQVAA